MTNWSRSKKFTLGLLDPKYPFPVTFMVCQEKFRIKVIANTKQKHAHHWQIAQSGCLAKNNFKQKKINEVGTPQLQNKEIYWQISQHLKTSTLWECIDKFKLQIFLELCMLTFFSEYEIVTEILIYNRDVVWQNSQRHKIKAMVILWFWIYIYMYNDHSEKKLASSTECAAPLSHLKQES